MFWIEGTVLFELYLKNESVIKAATQVLHSSQRTWLHPQLENAFAGLASAKPEEKRGGQKRILGKDRC